MVIFAFITCFLCDGPSASGRLPLITGGSRKWCGMGRGDFQCRRGFGEGFRLSKMESKTVASSGSSDGGLWRVDQLLVPVAKALRSRKRSQRTQRIGPFWFSSGSFGLFTFQGGSYCDWVSDFGFRICCHTPLWREERLPRTPFSGKSPPLSGAWCPCWNPSSPLAGSRTRSALDSRL
jgi:hypothetical protein